MKLQIAKKFMISRFYHLAILVISLIASNVQADVLIDDFGGDKTVIASILPGGTNPNYGVLTTASAIGGRRAYAATVMAGTNVTSQTLIGTYKHSADDLTQGTTMIVWDGDNVANNINAVGLGGVNLGPGVDQGLVLNIVSFDFAFSQPVNLVFTVYDRSDATGNKYSRGTVVLTQSMLNKVVTLPFASMTQSGSNGAANFSNAGAVTL